MCPHSLENRFDAQKRITRLAPSPTGALHLGNARTFLINWAMARQNGWRIILRIEDLDTPRVKAGADRAALEDLTWLGLDWDEGPVTQLADLAPYCAALEQLRTSQQIYPCHCTRREIEQALSAPHADDHETRYPGTCLPEEGAQIDAPLSLIGEPISHAWRVRAPDEPVSFHDQLLGARAVNVQQTVGDFVVATKAGLPAYQLAVVIDDARQGITDVVRGDDLCDATARQLLLYRLLNLGTPPRYWHLPLVLGADGKRLAKRHGDTRVSSYRDQGVTAQRVIGWVAHSCGLTAQRTAMTAAQFLKQFDLERLPRHPITVTAEDTNWLSSV